MKSIKVKLEDTYSNWPDLSSQEMGEMIQGEELKEEVNAIIEEGIPEEMKPKIKQPDKQPS